MNLEDIRAALSEDIEVGAMEIGICKTEDGDSHPEKLVVIAEFSGPRVTHSDAIRSRIESVIRSRFSWRGDILVEIVRAGWLSAQPCGIADKVKSLDTARAGTDIIFDTSFNNNIQEQLKDAFEYFGSHSKIRAPTSVAHPRLIHLGNWVSLGRFGKIFMQTDFSVMRELVAQHYPTADFSLPDEVFEPRTPHLSIGDGTTIGDFFFINCNLSIEIGIHVGIADRCFISDANHMYHLPDIPPSLMPNEIGKPISIGDHSWLGINAVAINGATIGKHCIVSSNSVVSGNVPDYCVAIGNPARIAKINASSISPQSSAG